jgi:hypothetical protein
MEYCCTGLRNLVACAGGRGNAVVVWLDSSGEPRLLLQSRGVSFDDQSKLRPADVDVKVNLSAEIGMRYCPLCGSLLEQVINENRGFFQKLAKAHERFVASTPKF